MTARCALHECLCDVSSRSQTRVELNSFFVRFFVSPKFSHVSLGIGGWRLGSKERRCWANCPCNQPPSLPNYVVLIHQHYRRTPCDPNTARCALYCTIVHRTVKSVCSPPPNPLAYSPCWQWQQRHYKMEQLSVADIFARTVLHNCVTYYKHWTHFPYS